MVLFPVPRSLSEGAGRVSLPSQLTVVLSAWQQELLPSVVRFAEGLAPVGLTVTPAASGAGLKELAIAVEQAELSNPLAYQLEVAQGGITLKAASAEGAAYGFATLKQLIVSTGRQLPELTIDDYPDFPKRGVMLDVSRGKVPTMENLYRFVDFMADLKYNELQLYMEHTFAYREHQEVWQHYSPFTHDEILKLDRYCRERFIELVPNQNSFGHLTPWLIHDKYKHLAETLDGYVAWGLNFKDPYSLCPIEPAAIPFLEGLYDELLPQFSSNLFNVGCDETFDVGQGRSKQAVEEQGGGRVYLDFLLKIYELVKARGKTMMFWGDIILKSPEYISELPKDVIAMAWAYEASDPVEENCRRFAEAGIPFYVVPGTSTWNSLLGRTDNAFENLRQSAESGLRHGAIGYLNTIWGDNGHQDYEPFSYLPLAYGAGLSWYNEGNQEAPTAYLDQFVFQDKAKKVGQLLYDLGNLYLETAQQMYNGSVPVYVLRQAFTTDRHLKGQTIEGFDKAIAKANELAGQFKELQLTTAEASLIYREFENTIRMFNHGCELGKLRLRQLSNEAITRAEVEHLALDLEAIIAEHRSLWLERNRLGGLEEMSLKPLRQTQQGYADLLKELQ